MSKICPKCGLPKEICACGAIEKETSKRLKVHTTKKRFNKLVTIIKGVEEAELKPVMKDLKHKLACGGSVKDGAVVLQGDHKSDIADILVKMGYPRENIVIS
jgi:translation initiation factor 1